MLIGFSSRTRRVRKTSAASGKFREVGFAEPITFNFPDPDFGFVWDYSRDQNSNCVLNLKRRPPIVSYGVNHCKP